MHSRRHRALGIPVSSHACSTHRCTDCRQHTDPVPNTTDQQPRLAPKHCLWHAEACNQPEPAAIVCARRSGLWFVRNYHAMSVSCMPLLIASSYWLQGPPGQLPLPPPALSPPPGAGLPPPPMLAPPAGVAPPMAGARVVTVVLIDVLLIAIDTRCVDTGFAVRLPGKMPPLIKPWYP